jgi:hypothetical protein
MVNSVIAPVTATIWDDFQLVFNAFSPAQIMYFSYGLTVTVVVQFDNQQLINVNLTANSRQSIECQQGRKPSMRPYLPRPRWRQE